MTEESLNQPKLENKIIGYISYSGYGNLINKEVIGHIIGVTIIFNTDTLGIDRIIIDDTAPGI